VHWVVYLAAEKVVLWVSPLVEKTVAGMVSATVVCSVAERVVLWVAPLVEKMVVVKAELLALM